MNILISALSRLWKPIAGLILLWRYNYIKYKAAVRQEEANILQTKLEILEAHKTIDDERRKHEAEISNAHGPDMFSRIWNRVRQKKKG